MDNESHAIPHAKAANTQVNAQPAHTPSHFTWVWLVVLGIIAIVGGYFLYRGIKSGASSAASTRPDRGGGAPPVKVAIARRGDIPIYEDGLLGQVTPFKTVTVRTRVDGQLVKIYFTEGQMVHTGDLLAEIDERPFAAAVTQAEGQLKKDQALLADAQLDLKRYSGATKGTYPQQQIDTQSALVDQDTGIVQADQGNLDAANVQLAYCKITSSLDGRIGLRMVDQGNIVHAADANGIAVITQLQPIAVVFHASEDALGELVGKQNLPVEAWDRSDSTKIADGTLLALDNQVDPTSASVSLKAQFTNADNKLFPSQFINCKILVDTEKDKVIVPAAAVQQGPDSQFVYVVGDGNKVSVRNVTIGHLNGLDQAIESGLSGGEIVVTDGVDKLAEGSRVTIPQGGAATRSSTRPGGRGRRGGASSRPENQ